MTPSIVKPLVLELKPLPSPLKYEYLIFSKHLRKQSDGLLLTLRELIQSYVNIRYNWRKERNW
ncbi:hypothetical protein EPI10_024726 [Gossypium australe]|uniref:Uncharacterized protein n=1 Tax=Gossypium australe TaxID=47621 RepID=A0A5B6VZN2_9ROSI|nr:hypothetical protein EPI10_024726 [Gossypium australe]